MFVDFAQAYDSVHRDSLWNILRSFLVPEKLIRVLRACYYNTRGRVRVGGQLTDIFEVDTGLKQGCPLSCALFNITLEWVMRQVQMAPDPIRLDNGLSLDRLAYADDVDLMGEEWKPRDEHVAGFSDASGRVGLHIKEPKTKAMRAGRGSLDADVSPFSFTSGTCFWS